MSVQTSNHYLRAVKQFASWLVADDRLPKSPLARLEMLDVSLHLRHDRRALSGAELANLLNTTRASAWTYRGLAGPDRHALYVTACITGLRVEELAVVTPASFKLDAEPPVVEVGAHQTKNGKRAVQPLPAAEVPTLREHLAGRPAKRPVWPGHWHDNAAEMIQHDLAEAGIPYVVAGPDGQDLHADFHATCRHGYVAMMERGGIPLKTAMQLARHSDPRLTAKRYGRASQAELGQAINRLPDLGDSRALPAPCRKICPR
jgi:integrase